jgi:uncharacterized membrane protein YuzA (DUF378 family)
MKALDIVSAVLVIVGALNWGLVGLANFDLVATIAGGLKFGEANAFSRIVYVLVGVAAVVQAMMLLKRTSRGGLATA